MSFEDLFAQPDDEPEPDEEEEHDLPPWWGPPPSELGVCVALNAVVARSTRGFVGISHALVYTTGAELHFTALGRGLKQSEVHTFFHGMHRFGDEELPAGFLRIGVELADGSRISNLGRRLPFGGDEEPEGPVFHEHGGGGGGSGGGRFHSTPAYWLWPLPPPGPLRVWCEWPALDIPLSSVELDASALAVAAQRTQSLWEDG